MEDMLQVGVITSPHGVHGEVKVYPTTDDNRRFKKLKDCYIDTGKAQIPAVCTGCKFFKNMVILKFQGYDNPDAVEGFRQCPIMVTRENAVPLEKDECFITDIIQSEILDENGKKLGVLTDVLTTNANDVYVVKKPDGKELLLPVIKQVVKKIDVVNKKITVRLMEGLE